MEQEDGTRSESTLSKGSHRAGSAGQQRLRVLQPVLHCSKKGWGLRPILDLRLLNRSVKKLKFKMLTLKQFVT